MGVLAKFLTDIAKRRPQSALNKRKRHKRKIRRDRSAFADGVDAAASPDSKPGSGPSDRATVAVPPLVLADYTRERAAFERVRSSLLQRYPDKFVVFVDDDMLGPYDSISAAVGAARAKYGRRAIYAKRLIVDDSSR